MRVREKTSGRAVSEGAVVIVMQFQTDWQGWILVSVGHGTSD